jgi:hypothetical protein
MEKILISTKAELDAFYEQNGHQWDNLEWENAVWEIIERGLPQKSDLQCEVFGCKNVVYRYHYNMAGEIHNNYCKKHWKEIMPHVKSFS